VSGGLVIFSGDPALPAYRYNRKKFFVVVGGSDRNAVWSSGGECVILTRKLPSIFRRDVFLFRMCSRDLARPMVSTIYSIGGLQHLPWAGNPRAGKKYPRGIFSQCSALRSCTGHAEQHLA